KPLGNVQIDVAILELPCIDVRLGRGAQVISERGRLRVHVDEHESSEYLDSRLRQRELLPIHMGEVPLTDDALVGTVDVPAPAVKAALELRRVAVGARGAQFRTAMQAGVEVGTDVALADPCHDEGVRADVVDVIVAYFRDVLLAAGKLPGAG